jgi:Peptidase family S41
MVIDDAREQAWAAVRLMDAAKGEMGCSEARYWTVQEFLAHAEQSSLTLEEKETIVDQAILLLDQFYVHLPFKRARYAVDPVQRLRLIRSQLGEHGDLAFHREMLQVFGRLRDAHTFYGLPRPYRGAFAFLPFRLKSFHDGRKRRYIVTNVMDGFEHESFGRNAEITHWNGMSLERAIERESGFDPLGNEAARFIRGLHKLSNRSLSFAVPPEEDWVVLQYRPKGASDNDAERGILLPWYIATDTLKQVQRAGSCTSVNESMMETVEARKYLWHRKELARERQAYGLYGAGSMPPADAAAPESPAKPDLSFESTIPSVFEFRYPGSPEGSVSPESLRDAADPGKRFGYVRIRTFDAPSADAFIEEFGRILDILQAQAPDGLIVDVRSNPGGSIDAAERALGLLTPGYIQPALFHFLNTRLTQKIAESIKKSELAFTAGIDQAEWQPWVDDLVDSVFSGGVITSGRTLTKESQLNSDSGQRYQGPVTLITDALSYSATDLFAAGFQDNGTGEIIGVDENTGGGGANRWLHEELLQKLGDIPGVPLVKLPGGAQLGLAIRRSTRAGRGAGAVIEDVGVRRDVAYQATEDDLLHRDRGLLSFACGRLGGRPRHALRIVSTEVIPGAIRVEVSLSNVFRLEFLVNGLPQCSFAATDPQPFLVPTTSLKDHPGRLLAQGYAREGLPGLAAIPGIELPTVLRLVASASKQLSE